MSPNASVMQYAIFEEIQKAMVGAPEYECISNNPSFRLKHPAVLDGSDGADGT